MFKNKKNAFNKYSGVFLFYSTIPSVYGDMLAAPSAVSTGLFNEIEARQIPGHEIFRISTVLGFHPPLALLEPETTHNIKELKEYQNRLDTRFGLRLIKWMHARDIYEINDINTLFERIVLKWSLFITKESVESETLFEPFDDPENEHILLKKAIERLIVEIWRISQNEAIHLIGILLEKDRNIKDKDLLNILKRIEEFHEQLPHVDWGSHDRRIFRLINQAL